MTLIFIYSFIHLFMPKVHDVGDKLVCVKHWLDKWHTDWSGRCVKTIFNVFWHQAGSRLPFWRQIRQISLSVLNLQTAIHHNVGYFPTFIFTIQCNNIFPKPSLYFHISIKFISIPFFRTPLLIDAGNVWVLLNEDFDHYAYHMKSVPS